MKFITGKLVIGFYLFLLVFCFYATSGEITINIIQESPNTKQAVEEAIQQVSLKLMKQIIEPSKLEQKKQQIQKIISTYSHRYILSTHTTPAIKKDSQYVISVVLGFSFKNLKQILLEEDLFYFGTSHLRILPFIVLKDFINKEKYFWWGKNTSSPIWMKKQMNEFYNQVQKTLIPTGFFVINPEFSGSQYFILSRYSFVKPKKNNIFKLARFFKSHLVMSGLVKIKSTDKDYIVNLKFKFTIYHVDSGRLLAEMERSAKIFIKNPEKESSVLSIFLKQNPHFTKSLGLQLKSIYEAGQLTSHLLKITIQGKMNYKDSVKLKNTLIQTMKDIHSLKEHIIQSQFITYTTNTLSSAKNMAQKIKKKSFVDFYIRVIDVRKNHLILRAIPTS